MLKLIINLFYTLYIFFIIILSIIPISGQGLWHVDKIGHFGAYTVLAIYSCVIFSSKSKRIMMAFFGVCLGFLLEYIQSFIPSRTTSLIDGLVNTLGIICGLILFKFYGHYIVDYLKRFNLYKDKY